MHFGWMNQSTRLLGSRASAPALSAERENGWLEPARLRRGAGPRTLATPALPVNKSPLIIKLHYYGAIRRYLVLCRPAVDLSRLRLPHEMFRL
jgi:hypothetical protein